MNRKFHTLAFALIVISAFAFGQAGAATAPTPAATGAPTGGTKVGLIDFQTAILATNEGQREFATLQTKFAPKKSDLEAKQKAIEGLQKQLDTQGSVMSDDAKDKLARQVDQQKKDYQREFEDTSSDFDSQKNDILRTLGNKVYATLDKYSKENNYSVIIDVSNPQTPVLWASQATVITKAIVDAYNLASGVPAPPSAPKPAAPTAKPAAKPSGTPR